MVYIHIGRSLLASFQLGFVVFFVCLAWLGWLTSCHDVLGVKSIPWAIW